MARTFSDRTAAGEELAAELERRGIDADIAVAIPRGGLPLGRAVADRLNLPLDIVVAKKIGAPGNPEYAIGAVATDGSVWRNESAFDAARIDEDYFEQERQREAENAHQKADRYRTESAEPDFTGKRVLVVDDGVATGSTMRACIQRLRNADAAGVIVAVPVGPPDTISELDEMADEVVCLESPSTFRGVGQFYTDFAQVSDEEAIEYLEEES